MKLRVSFGYALIKTEQNCVRPLLLQNQRGVTEMTQIRSRNPLDLRSCSQSDVCYSNVQLSSSSLFSNFSLFSEQTHHFHHSISLTNSIFISNSTVLSLLPEHNFQYLTYWLFLLLKQSANGWICDL